MGLFGGWRLIDTAPLDTDVTLLAQLSQLGEKSQ
jgi:hypothetical protein